MAKDRKKLQHIHSSIPDKQPTPVSLEVGEIAVNNAANQEFLSIKNSQNKVKRFSSDEQNITWMEKKEVMPYEGYTRGSDGPAGATGPDSVTNDDLLQNKSNLIIKLNQVAATNTVKHDKVNGAKDIYGNCVNPTSDSGVTDGAGFAIDMSRYAMIGANPSFSSLTVTDKTDLSGNTTIADGDGTSTRSGHTLTIKTTDVVANDTNWTETITNKQSTVTNETDKITTLNESATTRNTTVGTETLHVSGTTTETHDKDVTITNNSGVTETTKGNVVENVSGTTTINHSGDTTTNESGNTVFNTNGNTTFMTSGNTVIHSDGAVGITAVEDIVATSSESSIIITANDDLCATAGDVAAIKGVNKTNVGIDCSDAGRTKVTNVYGDTINERANTADTRVTSAYTSATTATTVIGTANTSATTATLSGNTLVVNEATSISAKTPTAYVSGTTLDIKETNTDITSCGRISANTNDFEVKQCAANGKAIINSDDIDISGKTFDVVEATSATIKAPATTISGTSLTIDEGTSISAKTPSTTISGTNFTLNETNTTINSCGKVEITTDSYSLKQCSTSGGSAEFEFCNGYTVKSNNISLQQCGSAGTISISAQTQNINGGNLTINESGNTAINTTGTTNVKSTGNTNIETNGANNKVTIQASGTGGDVEVFAKDTLCMSGGSTAALVGTTKTNIGKNCSDAGQTTTLNLNGTTINETGTTVNISGSTAANISGASVSISGGSISEKSTGTTCIEAGTTAAIVGATKTNIGKNCSDDGQTTTLNINGTTINETGTTVNISGSTAANVSGATVVVSGNTTNISGATTLALSGKTVNVDATDIDVDASNNYCLSAATKANIYGKATNIGIECGGTIATATTIEGTTVGISGGTTNVSGGTINISGGSITETSTGKTCIQAGTDLNIGGYNNTKIGANCGGEAYSQNTTIYATTAVTINTPKTNITGDTYLSGKTYFNNTCESIDSNELSDALCEVFDRSEVTWKTGDYAATDENLKWYELWQNGAQLKDQNGNAVRIDIPKDHILKDASIVYGKANGSSFTACTSTSTDCHWYIKLVWNVFNPSTGHSDDKTVYLPADDFVTDIGGDNSNTDRGVNVNVWYDGKQNWVSATTSIKIAAPSGDKSFTRSNGNHSLTSYKLSYSHNGFSGEFDPFNANSSFTSPHSALSWTYESVTGETGSSYDTSAKKSFKIPKNLKHLVNDLDDLTIQYGTNVSNRTSSTTYDGSEAKTVDVPTTLAQISDSHVKDSSPSTANGTITIDKDTKVSKALTVSSGLTVSSKGAKISGDTTISGNVSVSGTITATQAIYSSDRNLKENIFDISEQELDKAGLVSFKTYNFKGEDNKMYGIIAQDLQEIGLGEIVYTKEDGTLAVDYTSLMILEIARLRRDNDVLNSHLAVLAEKVRKLEGEKKD